LAGGGAVLRVLKTVGHRGTETQRKAREVKTISGFLAFDFLCASVSLWLMVFLWGNDDFEGLAGSGAFLTISCRTGLSDPRF
jgi:hypothetical protein